MKQNQKKQFLIIIPVLFTLVFIVAGLLGCSDRPSVRMDATVTPDPMDMIQMVASQTAAAAPPATLPPGATYWNPAPTEHFAPHFAYDSTRWALKDDNTLYNLQIGDCTLSQSITVGHEAGPDWTTEQSSFQAGEISFLTILAKYQGAPRFLTFYAPNGTTFEITSVSNFAQCAQDGENVLKSLTLD